MGKFCAASLDKYRHLTAPELSDAIFDRRDV